MRKSRLFSGALMCALVLAGCSTLAPTGSAPTNSAPNVTAEEQSFLASSARTPHYNVMVANVVGGTTVDASATAAATTTTAQADASASATVGGTTSAAVGTTATVSTNPLVSDTMAAHASLSQLATAHVACSSERVQFFGLANLTDGNLHSAWGARADDANPTLTFDLKNCTTVRGLGIKQSGGAQFDVAVQVGNGAWQVINSNMTSVAAKLDWVDLKATQADRVQLRFHGDNVAKLLVCEVQWFGDACSTKPSPSTSPSTTPSTMPSTTPSASPSTMPSSSPSTTPSQSPSTMPSTMPSESPSTMPSSSPSTAPSTEACGCKVTGGGWIGIGTGKGHNKITFGLVAIEDNGAVKGNIEVNDHLTKTKFHGKVEGLTCVDNKAVISGHLDNGIAFTLSVEDNGEPGRNDRFAFSTSAGISVGGLLGLGVHGGGNIQIHHDTCMTPDELQASCEAQLDTLGIKCSVHTDEHVDLDLSDFDARCDAGDFDH